MALSISSCPRCTADGFERLGRVGHRQRRVFGEQLEHVVEPSVIRAGRIAVHQVGQREPVDGVERHGRARVAVRRLTIRLWPARCSRPAASQARPGRAEFGEFRGTFGVDLGDEVAERQFERLGVAAGARRLIAHDINQLAQPSSGQAERLEAVAEAPGAPRGRDTVAADVNRQPLALRGLGIASDVSETEELAAVACALGLVGPQQPHHLDLLVGPSASALERGTARFDLLAQPPHADAQPQRVRATARRPSPPASRARPDGGWAAPAPRWPDRAWWSARPETQAGQADPAPGSRRGGRPFRTSS